MTPSSRELCDDFNLIQSALPTGDADAHEALSRLLKAAQTSEGSNLPPVSEELPMKYILGRITDSEEEYKAWKKQTEEGPTFDVYRSEEDGAWVVHIDTGEEGLEGSLRCNEIGPFPLRVYINDGGDGDSGAVYENPPLPGTNTGADEEESE